MGRGLVALLVSKAIADKLQSKHKVILSEVEECFVNRTKAT